MLRIFMLALLLGGCLSLTASAITPVDASPTGYYEEDVYVPGEAEGGMAGYPDEEVLEDEEDDTAEDNQ
jgi:hypothetical protein